MKEEVYVDQFTPWKPNHLIDEMNIPVDALGGAIMGHMMQKDQKGLTTTCNLLYSVISANFYLDMFAVQSTDVEG